VDPLLGSLMTIGLGPIWFAVWHATATNDTCRRGRRS